MRSKVYHSKRLQFVLVRLSSSVRISTSPQSRRRHGRQDTREASTKNRCDSRPHFRTRCQDVGKAHNIIITFA
uniref:Uncharacterized protein n=1 Tax=Caenorhabditis japonica TaxID=281687 RepID=A0A8R1EB80_CAEJA